MASDVGGGTSLSMLRTMADAYRVQAMAGQRLTAWKALHAATRGSAQALGLADEIGSLDAGPRRRRLRLGLGGRRGRASDGWRWRASLHERVFAWMMLADERNLAVACVAGVPRFRRERPDLEGSAWL